MRHITTTLTFVVFLGAAVAAQHPTMPAGMSHEEHLRQLQKDDALKQRGLLAMGFDQDAVAHHFLLSGTGGQIVVLVKDAHDRNTLAQVRQHLREISQAFAAGVFDKPVETHAELPPGAAVMGANRAVIQCRYEERSDGGAVVIETPDAVTRDAVHAFLRYQIVEHKTGDPLTPSP